MSLPSIPSSLEGTQVDHGMRLFIAVHIPEPVRERLAQVQARARELSLPVTLTNPDGLHLTLAFLGETAPERVPALRECLDRACGAVRPFTLGLAGLGVFPNERRPRVLWAGLSSELPLLTQVHGALTQELRAAGFPVEDRAFRPHVTLGRAKEGWQDAQVAALRELIRATEVPLETWRVEGAHLVQSELRREGARYTTLYTSPLSGGS
jgi:RNA 2',3'-cyclic 3'-phosphodiesterase